ncbi:MAG: RiPP maturation radical SAM protein 1 [Chloroflexi bacterium]|uniref:RiPP maturation radical SAM C-methyltransferase n=1 Tax=Candidatus Chlorohelix allophototropha TaxID=3003348 RepID=A0A8T7M202_9CHLR|nr:RiPP maturation radical SAM protein 1 [Chloroflexota bacterium]WJW65586.1 RiPP maturation radical SAM C-methyltransferase [Chloroflexota bacterium L227-S17]
MNQDFTQIEDNVVESAESKKLSVALVTMPFAQFKRPSLQIGLLKSIAEAHGFPTTTFHLNLDFAKQIGLEPYYCLSQTIIPVLGEWLFSLAAFGDASPDQNDTFPEIYSAIVGAVTAEANITVERLVEIRRIEAPLYIEKLVENIAWHNFQVVGFTTTFQQNCASFALARALKSRYPNITLIFGGANFEGEMGIELVRALDFIDYAVIGEGDKAFPEFLQALQEGKDPANIPSVVCKRNGQITTPRNRPLLRELDELPTPDFTEYFERAHALELLTDKFLGEISLPFESSRGCWWGHKRHCSFCGLNGMGIDYRKKSIDRVLEELSELSGYPHFCLGATDSILDYKEADTYLSRLAALPTKFNLFYEVKANQSRGQIKKFKDAGINQIQPGIESLNSHVLQLMRKGITGIQNVNTLRWAKYYRIHVAWQIIWGFPGETEEDYRQQAALMSKLFHLEPPTIATRMWLQRFSPSYTERENFPTRFMRPDASYALAYPETIDLNRIAYFFDYEFEQSLPLKAYEELNNQVEQWNTAWQNPQELPSLRFRINSGELQIFDRRDRSNPIEYNFDESYALLYHACSEKPHSSLALKTSLNLKETDSQVRAKLLEFCEKGLMMQDGSFFLSLALPVAETSDMLLDKILPIGLRQKA